MKFSIIIPVYNPDKKLFSNCLESINNQTSKNFEVIIVDDGSTNECEDVYSKYDSFKIYKIKNSGVCNARNYGLKKANGDYIIFVDADDTLPNNIIELYEKEICNDYDLILGKVAIYKDNLKSLSYSKYTDDCIITSDELLKSILMTRENGNISLTYSGAVWGKCFKSSIIRDNNLRFVDKITIGEDGLFNIEYILKCKKIYYINSVVYDYYINSNSAMNKFSTKVYDSSILLKNYLNKFENYINNSYIAYFNVRQLFNIFELYMFNSANKKSDKKEFKKIVNFYKNDIKLVKAFNIKKEYVLVMFLLKYFRNFNLIKTYFIMLNKVRLLKKRDDN